MMYTMSNYSLRNVTESTPEDFSMYSSHHYQQPTTFSKSMYKLQENEKTKMPHGLLKGDDIATRRTPSLSFIMNDPFRSQKLRQDYEMPAF
jgi:hypothetical protein